MAACVACRSCSSVSPNCKGDQPLVRTCVDESAVAAVVGDWTGIPVGRMVKSEISSVLALADTLTQRVLGQDAALATIARRVQTARASLEDPSKPVGVFLLAGPPASARRRRRSRWPKRSTAASRIWSRST